MAWRENAPAPRLDGVFDPRALSSFAKQIDSRRVEKTLQTKEDIMKNFCKSILAVTLASASLLATAQVPQYGTTINLEMAKKVVAAAEIEAKKNNWPVAIAVVDNAGMLVAYSRMDNTQTASVQVSIDKAMSAAMYRRSTKVFQDAVAGGGMGVRVLNLRGASAIEGGLTLMLDGKIIGGIGVSGVNSDQDAVVAKAGVDAVK